MSNKTKGLPLSIIQTTKQNLLTPHNSSSKVNSPPLLSNSNSFTKKSHLYFKQQNKMSSLPLTWTANQIVFHFTLIWTAKQKFMWVIMNGSENQNSCLKFREWRDFSLQVQWISILWIGIIDFQEGIQCEYFKISCTIKLIISSWSILLFGNFYAWFFFQTVCFDTMTTLCKSNYASFIVFHVIRSFVSFCQTCVEHHSHSMRWNFDWSNFENLSCLHVAPTLRTHVPKGSTNCDIFSTLQHPDPGLGSHCQSFTLIALVSHSVMISLAPWDPSWISRYGCSPMEKPLSYHLECHATHMLGPPLPRWVWR